MFRLKKYISPYLGYMVLTLLIKLLGTVTELMIPELMETILDDVVPSKSWNQIYLYGGAMLLCAVGCLVFNIWANRMSAISSGKITLALRHDLFAKLGRLSARQRMCTSPAPTTWRTPWRPAAWRRPAGFLRT